MSKFAYPSGNSMFSSKLLDCCSTNPEYYKVVAELPNARLVEMTVPPGGEDKPHDHPAHSMYFVKPAKLEIRDFKDGVLGEPHAVEIPAGAPPIFPPGAHQVKNIGDTDSKVIFVESFPTCSPCGNVEGFVKPFEACPECYKVLAEDDDWITGEVNMAPGAIDKLHNHKDHLIYVLEGNEVTIYPNGNMDDPHAVPIKPFAGIPAPVAAGPIFTNHIMKNSGTVPIKMIFFEMKK